MKSDIEIGSYLQQLRKERKMSLREVAEYVGIDVSMLSKIEHGERQLQSHMLKSVSEIFQIDYKKLCVDFFSQKLEDEYGNSPFIKEAAKNWLSKI
jgi:HTH-type transcriptional regulator, competence development regulator